MTPEIEAIKHIGNIVDGKLVCIPNCPSSTHQTPTNECKCELFNKDIVTTEYCPIHRGDVTPANEWREALQAEVMDDYLHLAEMRSFAKDPVAHMEEMREHWQKLQAFIENLLIQHSAHLVEKIEDLKKNPSFKTHRDGSFRCSVCEGQEDCECYAHDKALDQVIDIVKDSSQP